MKRALQAAWLIGFAYVLWAWAAPAQPQVTRGGALKKRAYQTYSALTLYVDPTGNDSNACTASGTAACLTIQGAVDKVPKRIRHQVTINVAAGTYSGNVLITGFIFEANTTSGITTSGPSFDITGTWATYTPTSGPSTGTWDSSVTNASPIFSTATLGSATWPVNELRGRYLLALTGTGAGRRTVIAENTGTVVSFLSALDSAGTTFSLQTPATIINGRVAIVGNTSGFVLGAGMIRLSTLSIEPASFSAGTRLLEMSSNPMSTSTVVLDSVRVVNNTATVAFAIGCSNGGFGASSGLATVGSAGLYVRGGSAGTNALLLSACNASTGAMVILQEGTGNAISVSSSTAPITFITSRTVVYSPGMVVSGNSSVALSGLVSAQFSNSKIVGSPAAGTCLQVGSQSVPALSVGTTVTTPSTSTVGLALDSCNVGIDVRRDAVFSGMSTPSVSFASTTTEVRVESVDYTLAQIQSLSPQRVATPSGTLFELH